MRKNYVLILLTACCLFTGKMMAQCGLTLSTTATTVCAGDNVTLTATATPPVNASALTTTLAGGNNHRGNMFDIYATNTVTISSFDAHPMGNTTIEIYYRTSPYAGFESTSSGWTLIGSAAVTAQPFGTATPVPVAVNVTIPAGQTYSFYVTSTNTAVSLNYTDGSSEGATYVSDANIIFRQGVGMEYPFTNGTGSVFRPRVWNGIIHYTTPVAATYSYLWNTTATTQSITPTVTSSTQYTVQVDVTGCPTMYDTVDIQVSTPPVNAGADVAVCAGSQVTLSGSGAVSYAWNNSVNDGVAFTPSSSMSYIVTGTDSIGCTRNDTVMVTVNNLPAVSAGSDFSVCAGSQATLSGSGAVSYSWDNSVTDGVPFVPASTMSYVVTGIDGNNCMNTDTVMVTVNTVNTSTSMLNETITALASGASYQWMDCSTNSIIAAENGQSYTATANGSYAVIVTENGCTDTSACETILTVGIENVASNVQLSIYPNPTNGQVIVTTGNSIAAEISITDITGKTLESVKPVNTEIAFDLSDYANGMYLIKVTTESGVRTSKVTKF